MNNSNSSSTGKLSELNETNGGASSTNLAANAREQYVPVYKWSTEKVIEHLNKRLSQQPTQLTSNGSSSFASLSSSLASSSFSASSSPSTLSPDKLNRLNQIFTNMKINGEALLELNSDYIDYLNINDSRIKEILLEEISLLKLRSEYDFIKRFKSQQQQQQQQQQQEKPVTQ